MLRDEAGNDVYFVDHAGDVVVELAGEGSDRVTSLSTTMCSAPIYREPRATRQRTDRDTATASTTQCSDRAGRTTRGQGRPRPTRCNGNSGNDVLDGEAGDGNADQQFNKDTSSGAEGLDQFGFGEGEDLGAARLGRCDHRLQP